MKYLLWISALLVALALPSAVYGVQDPCALAVKSSTPFSINTGGFQQVIAGVTAKRIFVCNVVFSGSSGNTTAKFNISFAGGSSGCSSGFTQLGGLFTNNNAVVSAGGGSSTQFTVPVNDNFCIELGGATPGLRSSGWVVFVQQ
jgi:hypothetical protein